MSYNHKRHQQHNDDYLPRVFQRLGSSTRSNSYNNNSHNSFNGQHHYTDEIVNQQQQRSDVGLRIARYEPFDNYSNNNNNSHHKKNSYSSYPNYSKISQLDDNAIYFSSNKNNDISNNNNNNYQQSHQRHSFIGNNYQQSPVVSNPPAPKNSFSFVRSESPKEISRPIISFLRDNNNNPPPNNNDNNNNNNGNFNYYNNDQQQQHHNNVASPASVYSDLSVDYTPTREYNSDTRVVIDDSDDDNDDNDKSNNSKPQHDLYPHNKMGKNILITASLPSSNASSDKNGDEAHEKQVAITSTRKVTVASSTAKRDRSSRSRSPPMTKIYRQSSISPPPQYNKRTRSYSRSPSPRRPRRRPSPPIDSDEEAPFLRLEADLYTPNYEPTRRSKEQGYTHVRDAVNDRLSAKPKDLRSYPPLGSSDTVLVRKNAAAASTSASSKPKDLRSYPPLGSSFSPPAPTKKDLRSYPPLGSSSTSSSPPKKDLRSYPPLSSSDPSAAARPSSSYNNNNSTNNAVGSPVSHNKVWVKPSENNQKPVPATTTSTTSRPSSLKKTATTPIAKKPVPTTTAKPVITLKPINNTTSIVTSKPAAPISKSATTTTKSTPISHKIITKSTTVVKEKSPASPKVADSSFVVNNKRNSALDNKNTTAVKHGTSVNTTVKHGTHQNTSDNITKANHSPLNHDKTPVTTPAKLRRVFTDGPPVPQAPIAKQQAHTSRQQEARQQEQEASKKAAALKAQQENIEKDKKAKELLRQLAIDERDDIVMDIMPSAPLVSSPSSRVVVNRRHSDCRNNSNSPKTVTLKQEPMNEDPPVNVTSNSNNNGAVVEAVVQQETSIPEPIRKKVNVTQPDNNTALREAMDHVESLADTIMNVPNEDTVMTERNEEMNGFLPVTKVESPSPSALKDKIRNAKTPPPIITQPQDMVSSNNEQQLISPPASSHKEELEETPLPPALVSTLPPSIMDTSSTKKKRTRLPPPWKVKMTDLGDIYYHNPVTGEDRVTRPVA